MFAVDNFGKLSTIYTMIKLFYIFTLIFFSFSSYLFSYDFITHLVKKGDNLYRISKKYNVKIKHLEKLNKLDNQSKIDIGDNLKIRKINKISDSVEFFYHYVESGETLFSISKKFNTNLDKLKKINKIKKKNIIFVGQKLKIQSLNFLDFNTDNVLKKEKNNSEKKNVSLDQKRIFQDKKILLSQNNLLKEINSSVIKKNDNIKIKLEKIKTFSTIENNKKINNEKYSLLKKRDLILQSNKTKKIKNSKENITHKKSFNLKKNLENIINNHNIVVASKIDVKAAKFLLEQSKGGFYPTLDVTASFGHENINKYGPGNNTQLNARDATAKITQTITDFGLTSSIVETSKLSLKQIKLNKDLIKNNLLLRSINSYLRFVQATKSVEYAKKSVSNIKKQTELENAAVSAGGGLTSDVLQAKTQLAGAEARLTQFQGILASSIHEFEYLFGFSPNEKKLPLIKSISNFLPLKISDAEQRLLSNNFQLKNAKFSEDIAKQGVRTAKASLFPTLKATLSHSEKNDYAGIVGFKRETTGKIDFSFPLNLSFSEYSAKNAAVETYNATQQRLLDQSNVLKQILRTTWDTLETARKNEDFLSNQAKISEEFLKLARKERKAGNRTLLDVLGGETALINSRSDAIAAKIETLISGFTLLSLMGELTLDKLELEEIEDEQD